MRISDWSSDVCSSDLCPSTCASSPTDSSIERSSARIRSRVESARARKMSRAIVISNIHIKISLYQVNEGLSQTPRCADRYASVLSRSEEHTSELQSLMRISYAVFCLKKNIHSV